MKKTLLIAAMLFAFVGTKAQQVSELYQELPNPVATDASKWVKVTKPVIAWGSTDVRYNKELPASVTPVATAREINSGNKAAESVVAKNLATTSESLPATLMLNRFN